MPEIQSKPEQDPAAQTNKIYHFGDVDAVMPLGKHSSENYEAMVEVVSMAANNTLDGLETAGNKPQTGRFTLLPAVDGGSEIFIKQKKSSGLTEVQNRPYLERRSKAPEEKTEHDSKILRGMNAHHSILNELKLASEIKTLADSEEYRGIVADSGFSDIALAEPIFGVVSRKVDEKHTAKQYVAYEYIPGAETIGELQQRIVSGEGNPDFLAEKSDVVRRITGAAVRLKEYFEKHGFNFDFSDYQASQFLYVAETNALHIIDIEGWHKKA